MLLSDLALRRFRNNPTLNSMTDYIQTLGIVARLFPEVLSGRKTSTIRWREPHIEVGPLRFICDDNPSETVLVDVLRCTEMPLSEAASYVGKAEEWSDQVMLDGMREHYPDIQLTSIVQVIEYKAPCAGG